jgi:hypothetical protein
VPNVASVSVLYVLGCPLFCLSSSCVWCAQCCQRLCIVRSWLSRRVSLTFISSRNGIDMTPCWLNIANRTKNEVSKGDNFILYLSMLSDSEQQTFKRVKCSQRATTLYYICLCCLIVNSKRSKEWTLRNIMSLLIYIKLKQFFISISANFNEMLLNLLSCKICRHPWFRDKEAWKTHHLTCHRNEVVAICEECCKTFRSYTGFTDHNKKYHSSPLENHQCRICNKSFISSYKLGIHERSHSTEKPYKCLKCGNSYKHKQDLQKHELIKHNNG